GPEVLKAYATSHGADPKRWWWLTGERERIYQLVRDSFHLAVEQNEGTARIPGNEVTHSTRLVLVDRRGRIRGYFEGRQVDDRGESVNELPQLRQALDAVVREGALVCGVDLPSVNATLNGISALLLIVGYAAIRRRRIALHKACMLAALGGSVLFLASYLYYHLVVRQGQPTSSTGTGWVRTVYFAILLSHTVLAALVAPLALFTASQALRGRLARHVRVARWTLPIWLYVSV